MGEPSLTSVLDCLHRVVGPTAQGEVSDAELLERFVRTGDQAAFELLVWRHGPMVLALCRRLLRHEQDAEDALQATFLVLVRKAGSITKKQSLASWLYKVAYRIACRARLRTPVLTNHAALTDTQGTPAAETEVMWRDLRDKLDGEISQLPETYRRPLILCYLEGKTHDEAARMLGCPKGTLASQVARARDRLHRRLTRRGWEFPAAALTALIAEKALAVPIPAELVHATLRSALAYASGQAAVIASVKAVGMAEGALRVMWYGKLKIIGGVLLAAVVSATGIAFVARDLWAAGKTEQAQAAPKPTPKPADPELAFDAKLASEGKLVVVGTVVAEDDKTPLEGVEVTASAGIGSLFTTGTTRTDQAGKFRLIFRPGISVAGQKVAGVAVVSAYKPGWRGWSYDRPTQFILTDEPLSAAQKKENTGYTNLTPGKPSRLTFHMLREASLRIRMVDGAGKPMANVRVWLTGDKLPPGAGAIADGRTDAGGAFAVKDVPRSRYRLVIEDRDAGRMLELGSVEFRDPAQYTAVVTVREWTEQTTDVSLKVTRGPDR
jgi:RNA polymerase sigma factor (sigma-70 family)